MCKGIPIDQNQKLFAYQKTLRADPTILMRNKTPAHIIESSKHLNLAENTYTNHDLSFEQAGSFILRLWCIMIRCLPGFAHCWHNSP